MDLMFDSVNPAAFPATGFAATAGYIDGKYQSSPGIKVRFSNLPHLTIAVFASDNGDVLDIEQGAATPEQAPAWLDRQYLRGKTLPMLYCNGSQIAAVRAACGNRRYLLWVAHYTYAPHICGPGSCSYLSADATQFSDKGPNSENVDQTLMSPNFLSVISGKGPIVPDYQRLIDIARSQIGTQEGIDSAGDWNNDQKYSKELPGFAWSNFQPWCDTFVAWNFWQAGLLSILGRAESASVFTSYQAWLALGRFTEYPTKGAQVIYGKSSHTGICVDYDATYLYAVEGNTNTDGSAEGNGVYLKRRLRTDPYVTGYGVPAFPDGVVISADPAWHHPTAIVPPIATPAPPRITKVPTEVLSMKVLDVGPAVDSPPADRGQCLVTEFGSTILNGPNEAAAVARIVGAQPGEYVLQSQLDAFHAAVGRARS